MQDQVWQQITEQDASFIVTLSFTDTRMTWSTRVARRSHSCMSGAMGIRHYLQAKCGCEPMLTDRNVHLLRQLGQQMIFVVI